MDINSIIDRSFTEAMRGYKKEEVDEVLGDIAREFSQLKKENADLEKKLQVCADKIREYREDEDALKDALLGAQKAGKAVLSEANEKAAGIIKEAEDNAADRRQEADDYVADRKAEAEKIISDALAEKKRIEEEAQKAKDDIHAQMVIQTELDKEVLDRTKREAEDFRTRIIVEYQNHIEFIKKIPEACFNEFVVENSANHNSNTLRELIAAQQGVQAPVIPEIKEEKITEEAPEERDSDVKVVESISGIEVSGTENTEDEEIEEQNEYEAAPEEEDDQESEFEENSGSSGSFTVENAFGDDDDEGDDSLELPDFLSSRPTRTPNGNSKYDKLEFGSNNNDNRNGSHKKKRR
ncbi:MAG: DivIVA domain-containing protein [Ruminiclostridium sp.]|nr:DivIVA domain-containing protein [Ruminiclostridium sp.]